MERLRNVIKVVLHVMQIHVSHAHRVKSWQMMERANSPEFHFAIIKKKINASTAILDTLRSKMIKFVHLVILKDVSLVINYKLQANLLSWVVHSVKLLILCISTRTNSFADFQPTSQLWIANLSSMPTRLFVKFVMTDSILDSIINVIHAENIIFIVQLVIQPNVLHATLASKWLEKHVNHHVIKFNSAQSVILSDLLIVRIVKQTLFYRMGSAYVGKVILFMF